LEKVPADNKPAVSTADSGTTLSNWNVNSAINAVTSGTNKKIIEAHLHWSEYYQGQWTTKQSGNLDTSIQLKVGIGVYSRDIAIYVTKESKNSIDDTLDGAVHINLYETKSGINRAFRVVNKNSVPEILSSAEALPAWPFERPFEINRIAGYEAPMTVKFEHYVKTLNGQPQSNSDPQTILGKTVGDFNLVPCSEPVTMGGPELGQLVTPFFYQDSWHTFYVEPVLTETITIDEWDEWVSGPATSEPSRPKFGDIKVDPIYPWPKKFSIPRHGDPGWLDPDDSRIKITPKAREDWATRPGTYVKFDERVIGKESGMNLIMLNDTGKAKVIKDSNQLNTVISSNSAVANNIVLVSTDTSDKTVTSGIASTNSINVKPASEITLVGGGGIAKSELKSQAKHFGGAFSDTLANKELFNKSRGGF
jgi:hypothetical protein